MITFLDHSDTEYGTLTSITVGNGVNGERTISGTIVEGEHVIHNIDLGWRLRFEDEYYAVVFAEPIDLGNRIEVQFDAVHQFFYDFSKSVVHRRLDGSNTMQNYLNFIFSGSGYSFSLETTIGAFPKENFGYKSRLTLFNDIMSSIDAEFVVHGRVVRILSRVGTDLTTVVKKGFNLNEIRLEKNIGNFITRKKGYGAYLDKEDQSKGRIEVEYISPLESIYGVHEGEPVMDERYSVVSNLEDRLQKEVDSSYDISVQIDMEDLTKAGYEYDQPRAGDYITAINDDLGFRRSVRIVSFKSEYDIQGQLIKHDIECNSLGQVKKEGNEYTRLEKEFNDKLAEAEDKFLSLVSANGRNRNYYGSEFPLDEPKGTLVVGDQLFLTVGEMVKRYYWNGEEWVPDPFSENPNWITELIEATDKRIREELLAEIEESDRKAANAVSKAEESLEKIGTINTTITDLSSDLKDTDAIVKGVKSSFETFETGFSASVNDLIGNYSQQGQTINGLFSEVYSADGRVSQAIQTADGFKQTVEDLESGTGTIFEQLSNGFRQRIDEYLGDSTKFSQIESSVSAIELAVGDPDSLATSLLTSELWRTEVTNLTQQKVADELKQEFKTVISPVHVVNAEDFNNGETFSQGKYFYYNGVDRDTDKYLQTGVNHVIEITMPGTQNRGQSVSLRVKDVGETSWSLIGANFNLPTGEYKIVYEFTSLVSTTRFADYRLTIYDDGGTPVTAVYSLKIYRNEEVQVPIEGPETGAISSQITQLYNMINLSILGKDGAMSRIAMGEEGIQIDGKLLHITAKTYIDDAVIKNAMIDTVSANKLTAGTIDASQINVINLDANNITANRGRFIQLAIQAVNSDMRIDGTGLTIDSHSGWDAKLLNSGLAAFTKEGARMGSFGAVRWADTAEDAGVRMMANRGYKALISYQGTRERDIDSINAVAVDGTTGDISLKTKIFGGDNSTTGFSIGSQTIGGVRVTALYAVDRSGNEIGAIGFGGGNFYYASTYNQDGSRIWTNLNNKLA